MDPQKNIAEQVVLANDLLSASSGVNIPDDAVRLAELVLALDGWRKDGGYDPYAPLGEYVVVTGDPRDGFEVFGPYASHEEASEFAAAWKENWWVMPITKED